MGKRKTRECDHVQGQCDVWLTKPKTGQKKQRILSIHPVNIIGSRPLTFNPSASSSAAKTKQSKLMMYFKPKSAAVPQQQPENWKENEQFQAPKKPSSIVDQQTPATSSADESTLKPITTVMDTRLVRSNHLHSHHQKMKQSENRAGSNNLTKSSQLDPHPLYHTASQYDTPMSLDSENDSSSLEDINLSDDAFPDQTIEFQSQMPTPEFQDNDTNLRSDSAIEDSCPAVKYDSNDFSLTPLTQEASFHLHVAADPRSRKSGNTLDINLRSSIEDTCPSVKYDSNDFSLTPITEEPSFHLAAELRSGKSNDKTEHASTTAKLTFKDDDTDSRSAIEDTCPAVKYDSNDFSPTSVTKEASFHLAAEPRSQKSGNTLDINLRSSIEDTCPAVKYDSNDFSLTPVNEEAGFHIPAETRSWKYSDKTVHSSIRAKSTSATLDDLVDCSNSDDELQVECSQSPAIMWRVKGQKPCSLSQILAQDTEVGSLLWKKNPNKNSLVLDSEDNPSSDDEYSSSPLPLDMIMSRSSSLSQLKDHESQTDSKLNSTSEFTVMSTNTSEGDFESKISTKVQFHPMRTSPNGRLPMHANTRSDPFKAKRSPSEDDSVSLTLDTASQMSLDTAMPKNSKCQRPVALHDLLDTQDNSCLATSDDDDDDEYSQDIDSLLSPHLTQDSIGAYRLK